MKLLFNVLYDSGARMIALFETDNGYCVSQTGEEETHFPKHVPALQEYLSRIIDIAKYEEDH